MDGRRKLGADFVLCIARSGAMLDVRIGKNYVDYGVSEEVSEGIAVRASEAAGSSGLSGGSTRGRSSWLN